MVGVWKLDVEYLKGMPLFQKEGGPAAELLYVYKDATFTVTRDRMEYEVPGGGLSETMTYVVKSQDDDGLAIEVTVEGKASPGEVRFEGERMILTKPGDPVPFVLVRK